MKSIHAFAVLFLLFTLFFPSCCDKDELEPGLQKITYRLTVTDKGNEMSYCYDCYTHCLFKTGVYDTTFYRDVNEYCYFKVNASCNDDQKICFYMQILRNDVEVKSKSYTRHNVCGDVSVTMNYFIVP